jgi:predicted transposase YdaD
MLLSSLKHRSMMSFAKYKCTASSTAIFASVKINDRPSNRSALVIACQLIDFVLLKNISSSSGMLVPKFLNSSLALISFKRLKREAYLPTDVKKLIDLDYLERQPNSFVDAQHRFLEVDILFKARCKITNQDCYIWLLIEQQRQPDVWLPLRLYCYLGIIWDHIRKASKTRAKSAKIPFIYPLVISNASTPYRHSLTLRDMIEPEEAKPLFDKLFNTPSQLIDLAAIPDEKLRTELQKHVQAQALLLSLKHVFDKNLPECFETVLLPPYQALEQLGYKDEVADLLYYIYTEGNLNDSSRFWSYLHRKFSKEVEEKVMTLGQQAEQRAMQQGMQQGARQIAIRMLEEQFDIKLISKITNLSLEEIKRLAKREN